MIHVHLDFGAFKNGKHRGHNRAYKPDLDTECIYFEDDRSQIKEFYYRL